jgi:hypothetical protein
MFSMCWDHMLGKQSTTELHETGSHCVAQVGLELAILLPLPPRYWNYRYVALCLTRLN